MSFVKIGGEDSGEAVAEAVLQDLAQVGAKGGGETVAQVAAGAAAAAHAASAIGTLLQAGSEGSGQGQVAAATPGIAGGAAGAAVTAPSGAMPGLVSAVAGVAGGGKGAGSAVQVALSAVVAGVAGGGKGAGSAAQGALSTMAGAVAAVKGVVSGATPGIAGGLSGAPAVISGGLIGEAVSKLQGIVSAPDLPIFPDIAVTAGPLKDKLTNKAADVLGTVSGGLGLGAGRHQGKNLEVELGSGDALDVRSFTIHERLSSLFQISLIAVSENPSIDFDAVVGKPARFAAHAGRHDRSWGGLCNHIEQVRAEPDGLSTYQISIVPDLWLLTQRKNHRMFQQISEPDIAIAILKEWDIEPDVRIDRAAYKKRKYRVQYAESDFAFISRVLEDAGIAFYFEQDGERTRLVLSDAVHATPPRAGSLSYVDDTSMAKKNDNETVTSVRMTQRVRPGKLTLRDHDYRRPPSYKLMTTASGGRDVESKLERYHYTPGAFLFGTEQGDASPSADDKGKTRTDEKEGAILAQKRLDAKRGSARVCTFETNAHDLAPAMVITMSNHPHEALGEGKKLLVVESSFSGTATGDWSHHCEARSTDVPYRPELVTPRPKVNGVESATVVGPAGEEIHTDEFGRVRVHFHWDRESQMDHNSSCWIHVSQPWGGASYGGINLPRVGQEVLVDFLGGDPDRPIIVGRVYTNLQKVPYKLPQDKTKSGWKSNSTGGGGGYNEVMFEDAQGKELINIQAEKDLTELVKHDAKHTVKNDRTTTVWNDNSQLVGRQHSLTIASSVTSDGPQAGPTKVTMVHERIELTTGKASIILDGPNIIFRADNDITSAAVANISSSALTGNIGLAALLSQVSLMGFGGVAIATPSIVQIDGATAVLINCVDPKTQTVAEEGPGFWGTVGAVALGVGVAAAVIAAPVLAGVVVGGALAYGMLSK